MEANAEPASGDGLESLGPGDGGHGVDYEFSKAEKGNLGLWAGLGFVGADKVKELKRTVKEAAWEKLGQGNFEFTKETEDMEVDDSE